MWIALAVSAVLVVAVGLWWLRRGPLGGDGADERFEDDGGRGWASRLGPEAGIAFMEGLRACSDEGEPLSVGREQGVLTTYDPPRLISLHLLADRFAATGEDGLHDPERTVSELIAKCSAVEQPGVLHLRTEWLTGMVDGMDQRHFAEAVREIVCGPRTAGVAAWSVDENIGSLQITVRDQPAPPDGDSAARPATALQDAARDAPASDATPAPTTPSIAPTPPPAPSSAAPTPPPAPSSAAPTPPPAPSSAAPTAPRPPEPATPEPAAPDASAPASGASEGADLEDVNTMMLDLALILDRYREVRAEQRAATVEALLRTVVSRVIAGGGPGVTWVRPPSPRQHQIVLAAATAPDPR
ncbi:hypothetical protein [Nonomuraea lactucae]|uniref:hypothetical protein n=1 Tax=Nonomuraea lactucae TaxID=2249762 RepID=UPI000DE45CFA|nr:hypothetical protein [Nonomuraea lactucae]